MRRSRNLHATTGNRDLVFSERDLSACPGHICRIELWPYNHHNWHHRAPDTGLRVMPAAEVIMVTR